MTQEHDLGGFTVIVEWSPKWSAWMGTITDPNGHSSGTVMRDSQEEVLEAAQQSVDRKG